MMDGELEELCLEWRADWSDENYVIRMNI